MSDVPLQHEKRIRGDKLRKLIELLLPVGSKTFRLHLCYPNTWKDKSVANCAWQNGREPRSEICMIHYAPSIHNIHQDKNQEQY